MGVIFNRLYAFMFFKFNVCQLGGTRLLFHENNIKVLGIAFKFLLLLLVKEKRYFSVNF